MTVNLAEQLSLVLYGDVAENDNHRQRISGLDLDHSRRSTMLLINTLLMVRGEIGEIR